MSRSDVARLLWITLEGRGIDREAGALLEAGAGGVVLFSRNIAGVDQLRDLVTELRARARGPLRIAIDHEGGHVARVGAPLTRFPSAMAVAATGSEELAEACARAAARELSSLGIDVNLAPVLDVAADPRNPSVGVRAFASDPAAVASLGAATVRGYRSGGVAATAKHFPGHGRTAIDPHHALPTVKGGLDALRRTDLPPFRAAIEAGVDMVMATHAAYADLTDGLPTTISPRVMTELLRRELGFEGLLLTDAMVMGAIADDHPIAAASARAIIAGADAAMPLVGEAAALGALQAALDGGELSTARLSTALRRADELDRRLAECAVPPLSLPEAEHGALALEVARRSLTLRSSGDLFPLASGTAVAVVEFASRRPSPIEESEPDGGAFSVGRALGQAGLRPREVVLSGEEEAGEAERQAALAAAADADLVLLATRDAFLWPADRALVADLGSTGRPTILVALRSPYDLEVLAPTNEAIAAYADVPATLRALAEAVARSGSFPGRLPMRLAPPAAAA